MSIVIPNSWFLKIFIIPKFEINIEEIHELILNLTPVLKPSSKTHGVIFFEALETDSDIDSQGSSSAPSTEEAEVLQSSTSARKKVLDDLVRTTKSKL